MNKYIPTLTQLTFSTSVFGGMLWLNRIWKNNNEKDIVNSIGFKTTISIFYAYLAININRFFLEFKIVDPIFLYNGYIIVFLGLSYEFLEELTRDYRMRYYNSIKYFKDYK